jgi:hypothetical protein
LVSVALTYSTYSTYSARRAVLTISTPTFSVSRRCRLVYLETGGNLEAIPWEVLVDAVRRSIWPNLVLERIREWQWNPEVGMGVDSSAEVEFAMRAAA